MEGVVEGFARLGIATRPPPEPTGVVGDGNHRLVIVAALIGTGEETVAVFQGVRCGKKIERGGGDQAGLGIF